MSCIDMIEDQVLRSCIESSKLFPRPPTTLIAPVTLQKESAPVVSNSHSDTTNLCLRRTFVINDTVLCSAEPTRPNVLRFALFARSTAAEAIAVDADLLQCCVSVEHFCGLAGGR